MVQLSADLPRSAWPRRGGLILRACLILLLVYCVVRFSIVVGVPQLYPNEAYVQTIYRICKRETSLCRSASVQRSIVGVWWGYAVGLEAVPGRSEALRALVLKEVVKADDRHRLGPWRFVALVVWSAEQPAGIGAAEKSLNPKNSQ